MSEKPEKIKKRVPWHITLFTGAAWFLLAGGLQVSVLIASGLMIAGGVLYLAWPKLKARSTKQERE